MTAEPENVDRLEIAERLLTEYEAGNGTTEDLIVACEHAESVTEGERWFDSHIVLAAGYEYLAFATRLQVYFDRAVEAAEELARWVPAPNLLVDAARVRLFRYYRLPGTVPERFASLEPAVDQLEHALAGSPQDEDRRAAETLLGLVTAERIPAGQPDPVTAARAIELLTAGLPFLELGDLLREVVVRTLAEAHLLRHTTPELRGGADPDDDLDIAIELYREAVHDYGTDVAPDLVEALVMRLYDRPTTEDREEAIRWLDESVVDCTDPAALDVEQAEQLGELLNGRAEDDGTAESASAAVTFLERAIDAVGPVSMLLNTQLMAAYGRAGRLTVDRLSRVVELIDVTVRDEPDIGDLLRCLRALALAERAQLVALPADYARARLALTEALSGTPDFDWAGLALLSALAVLITVEQGGIEPPPDWSPYRLGDTFPRERRVMVREWLEEHQPSGFSDCAAVIALLRADEVPLEFPSPAARVAGLRVAVPALAAVVGSGDGLIQLLVRRRYGEQLGELGRLTGSLADVRQAAVILDDVVGDLPAGHPLRAGTLGYFANNILAGRLLGALDVEVANARSALAEAIDDPTIENEIRAAFLLVLSSIELDAHVSGDRNLALPLAYAQRAVRELPDDNANQALARYQLAGLLMARFGFDGAIDDAVAARRHIRVVLDQLRRGIATSPPTEADALRILHHAEVQIGLRSGIASEKLAAADAAITAAELYDPADASQAERYEMAFTRGTALMLRAERTQRREDVVAALQEMLTAADLAPPYLGDDVAPTLRGGALTQLGRLNRDREQFQRGVGILDERAAAGTLDRRVRASAARYAALARADWSEITGDADLLDTAIQQLEESDALLPEGLEFRNAARMYALSAGPYWRRGRPADIRRAVRLELDSLRERGRDVLLQSNGDDALAIVADAAERSAALAARCLDLGLRSDAVRAVEAGRGLVLQAVTTGERLPALLREHGHDALADEWEREENGSHPFSLTGRYEIPRVLPSDLRARVVTALAPTDSIRVLLDIPTVHEIAAALRVLAADAVVYLLPSAGHEPGRALVASSDGEVADVPLPGLRDSELGPLRDYVAARAAAEDTTVPGDRRVELAAVWSGALDRLCDWAGRAVIGPLRDRLSGLGTTPHVVLVPSGPLCVVPWHAARSGARYAVSDFVFSYVSSARQLCALAARRHRPPAESAVVVADPTGTLCWAPVEARYVASRYPGSRCLTTPGDVLAALRTGGTTMAHFGCHAVSGTTPSTSYLGLAGDARLTVATIMAQRRPEAAGGLVVLAACQSGLTQTAHDEGLTLANAFVAAGATGVTGALWAVPDDASSVLMCLYHHELSHPGTRPVDALRAVQLWALGDDRAIPADLPAELRSIVSDADFRRPAIWAAFIHTGW